MEAMKTVIENVKDVAPVEAAQTAIKVATTKSSNNVVKTGGIIAGVVALVAGIGYTIYRKATKKEKVIVVGEPNHEAETHDDTEVDED